MPNKNHILVTEDQNNREELASCLRLLRRSVLVEANNEGIDPIKERAKFLLAETGGVGFLKKEINMIIRELGKFAETPSNSNERSSITAAGLFIGASLLLIASDSLAAFDPVITLVTDHFGKGVVAVGGVGALVTPGADLSTKAIGFGIGAAAFGLVMVAVRAGIGI